MKGLSKLIFEIMKSLTYVLFAVIPALSFNSCGNCEDKFYELPSEAGSYYLEIDTIIFLCQETAESMTFVVCERYEGYDEEEVLDGWCTWFMKYGYNRIELGRDSCGEFHTFRIDNNTNTLYTYSSISVRNYPSETSYTFHAREQESIMTIEILGQIYDNVYEFDVDDSQDFAPIYYSTEFGILQFYFDQKTFSLKRNENY